uniref:Histone domain-containing protein n=1 Tax=Strongyloides stercoralis TaxID=6248 RepID=A0A0K0ET02_STRER
MSRDKKTSSKRNRKNVTVGVRGFVKITIPRFVNGRNIRFTRYIKNFKQLQDRQNSCLSLFYAILPGIKSYLELIVRETIIHCYEEGRSVVTTEDVIHSLKKHANMLGLTKD